MISDCVTLGTVNYSRRPPNKKWIYGYGKLETVSSLFVAGILLGTSGAVFVHISNCQSLCLLHHTPMNCLHPCLVQVQGKCVQAYLQNIWHLEVVHL